MTRKLFALALILSLLLLAGCKQQNTPQSRLAEVPPDEGAAEAAPSGEASSAELEPAGESGEAETSSTSHGELTARLDGDVIEIEENLFVAQSNDIYLNPDYYMGRTISYEGIYKSIDWAGDTLQYVIRYGPGCCGTDGDVGFEVSWDGDLPEHNDWVKVVGVLDQYDLNGWDYLILRLDSLTVLEERGEEYVLS